MNRRSLIKSCVALGGISLLHMNSKLAAAIGNGGLRLATDAPKGSVDKNILEARKKIRRRTRRIIMNNDGNDASIAPGKAVSPELFLSKRTTALIDSQVDSIFYCDGVNYVYTHQSKLTESRSGESTLHLIRGLEAIETDTLSVMINFCKQHGKEIFWSMRMNDNHDATNEYSRISKFKKQNPHLLVGKKGVKMPYMYNKWSVFDYGLPEVRQLAVDILTDVVTRYDVDGIELDFFRHPAYFKAQFYGEPVTQDDCNKMTQMVRNIRAMCDTESVRRGRPVLIAIRVPDSLPFAKAIGLDWEQWLKEELIDVVTGADYFKLEPWANMAKIGVKYNVPVYACLEQRRIAGRGGSAERKTTIERWRGEAYIAWQSGMNGIYTFNRFDPHDPIFREIGDPSLLAKLDMVREESYIGAEGIGYLDPGYWLKDGRSFLKKE